VNDPLPLKKVGGAAPPIFFREVLPLAGLLSAKQVYRDFEGEGWAKVVQACVSDDNPSVAREKIF
jgi:hypothetical protein